MDVCGIFLLALLVSIHNILSTHKEISFFLVGLCSHSLSLSFFGILSLSPNNNSSFFSVCIIYISICAFIFCNNYKYSIHLFSNTLIHGNLLTHQMSFFFRFIVFPYHSCFCCVFFSFFYSFCPELSLSLSLFELCIYVCVCEFVLLYRIYFCVT